MGEANAKSAAEYLACHHLRDYMTPDLGPTMDHLDFIYPLISVFDKELYSFLMSVEGFTQPHFCLSWILTWFAHDLPHWHQVTRLYDSLIVSHPLYSIYICAACFILQRKRILKMDSHDFPTLFSNLCKFPYCKDLEKILAKANIMYESCNPLELLDMCPNLSKYSVVHCFETKDMEYQDEMQENFVLDVYKKSKKSHLKSIYVSALVILFVSIMWTQREFIL